MLASLWRQVPPVFTLEFWEDEARAPLLSRAWWHLTWGLCVLYVPFVLLLRRLYDARLQHQRSGDGVDCPRKRSVWQKLFPAYTDEFWEGNWTGPLIKRDCRTFVWAMCIIYFPFVLLLRKLHESRVRDRGGVAEKMKGSGGVSPFIKFLTCAWNLSLSLVSLFVLCALVSCLAGGGVPQVPGLHAALPFVYQPWLR